MALTYVKKIVIIILVIIIPYTSADILKHTKATSKLKNQVINKFCIIYFFVKGL